MSPLAISLLVVGGLALLVIGAELLVRGAAAIATSAGISPLVIGLTVVAFGTSSPELAASLHAAAAHQPDLAVGNVVGSNIFNVLLILGLSAAVTPLTVNRQLLLLDVPVMVGVSLAVWWMAADLRVGRSEGLILVGAFVVYTVFLILVGRRAQETLEDEFASAIGAPGRGSRRWPAASLKVVAGLAMLVIGSRWLVTGSAALARVLEVPELVIGLTLLAAGTSLPEVATSVVAAVRGQRDIAVGNVIGSNVFNLTSVLGAAAVVEGRGLKVSERVVVFDLPVMVAAAAICWPLFLTGRVVARWEGWLLMGGYLGYTAWLMVRAGLIGS